MAVTAGITCVIYQTDVSIVPPFFLPEISTELGMGLYTGAKSDMEISKYFQTY